MENEDRDLCRAIISAAEKDAEKILASAREYAESVKEKSDSDISAYKKEEEAKTNGDVASLKAKRAADARMAAGKHTLASRTETVASVYEKVKEDLENLDGEAALGFLNTILVKFAEEGDAVVISKKAPYKAEDVEKLTVVKDKKLTLEVGDIDGGAVLKNSKYDRDYSYSAIVSEVKERTETDIAKRLFSGEL